MVDFSPMNHHFMQLYSQGRISYTAIPLLAPLSGFINRNWREAGARQGLPANAMKLADLVQMLQVLLLLVLLADLGTAITSTTS